MLSNIVVTPLKHIKVEGGDVLHALKNSDSSFNGFGEAYFSWISVDMVKAWKCHTQMTMNIIVPVGKVRFVFYEVGVNKFRIEDIGEDNYARISVPPGVWFGFKGLNAPKSLVLNIANILHEPDEVNRLKLSDINYDWS